MHSGMEKKGLIMWKPAGYFRMGQTDVGYWSSDENSFVLACVSDLGIDCFYAVSADTSLFSSCNPL